MYNAIIHPFTTGPMALTGFTFYQGEANTKNETTANQYACLFPRVIMSWRDAFQSAFAWFGFVQLSTWCAQPPESVPQMRDAQMAALILPNVGYATNADHGMGCNIHPAAKQYVGRRLAHAALAQQYKKTNVRWRSPTYRSASAQDVVADGDGGLYAQLTVSLDNVGTSGLRLLHPYNYESPNYGDAGISPRIVVDCTASYVINKTTNGSMAEQCAWAALNVSGGIGWLNATTALLEGGRMLLSALLPVNASASAKVVGSRYGWGPIPMMSVYDVESDLPVLPWGRPV